MATDQENQQWATPQNYKKNLFYPNGGIGSVVTYLEVIVDQVNDFEFNLKMAENNGFISHCYFHFRAQIWAEHSSHEVESDKDPSKLLWKQKILFTSVTELQFMATNTLLFCKIVRNLMNNRH